MFGEGVSSHNLAVAHQGLLADAAGVRHLQHGVAFGTSEEKKEPLKVAKKYQF